MTAQRPPATAAADGWSRGMLRPCDDGAVAASRRLVVKVGGSLLSRPGWPARLAALIATLDRRVCRIVVGGGGVVDGLRSIDRAAPQPPELMHALAIECMRLTAQLVSAAVGLPLVAGVEGPEAQAVLDVPAWLGRSAAPRLPAGWHVTSDSIAARVAAEAAAGLLLVKSVPPPPYPGGPHLLAALAAAGWVDGHFPEAAAGLGEIGWAAWDG
jgi:hypothetical protein